MWAVVESVEKLEYQNAWVITKPNGSVVTREANDFLKANPEFKHNCIVTNCSYKCKSHGKTKYCPEVELEGRGIKGSFPDKFSSDNSSKLMIHCRRQFLKIIPPFNYYADHGVIAFYKEDDNGNCLIRTDKSEKHLNNNKWTSQDNIVKGLAAVGDRLVSCGHQRDECQWRERVQYTKQWGGVYLSNNYEVATDDWYWGEVRYFCSLQNDICNGALYIVLGEKTY